MTPHEYSRLRYASAIHALHATTAVAVTYSFAFGWFHRAHQALLADRAAENAPSSDREVLVGQLRAQGHLYTVLEEGRTAIRR